MFALYKTKYFLTLKKHWQQQFFFSWLLFPLIPRPVVLLAA
jgi:hypothetical protein